MIYWPARFSTCLVLAILLTTSAQARPPRPNIVFVLIDDLGWMDLACQGNPLVETPHIDRLAGQGLRFTAAYAAAPVCSPTRAAILTGLSPARLQITNHIPDRPQFTPDDASLLPAEMLDHLPLERVTIAERLRSVGYATAFIGKWHLAGKGDPQFYPQHQGFDLNIAGCAFGGPPTFFDPYRIPTLPDRKPGEYLPDRLADEAIGFLEANQQRPFFLCLWNYTVHWPMEAPQALLDKYATRTGPGLNDTRYGAMIEAMDAATGRVLRKLDELHLSENTLVIFTSDNGGFGGVSDNRPLRAAKGHLYEGGIRVPLIVRWPPVVEAGRECDTPVISMDFLPTLLEVAGAEAGGAEAGGAEAGGADAGDTEPRDGTSLLPLLDNRRALQRDAIYFHYPNYAWHRGNRLGGAIRTDRFKLIERFDDGSLELYDLKNDLSERNNLAPQMPDVAASLQEKLAAWRTTVGARMPTRRQP